MTKIISIVIFLISLMQTCLATENISTYGKHHSFGINVGLGSVRTDLHSEKSSSGSVYGVSYGYHYDSNWTINAGYIKGEGFDFCIVTCLSEEEMNNLRVSDYDTLNLNLKGSLPLSNRWSVFGKIGINHYKSEYSKGYRANIKNSGTGALLAAGMDFRAYNGVGVGFEYLWLDMEDIYSASLMVNVSYLF